VSESNGNGFIYSEAAVARELGLSRDDAKLIRSSRLARDVHWQKKEREIALNKAGVVRLGRAVATKPATIDLSACLLPSLAKKDAPETPLALPEPITFARPATLRVSRLFDNPRILQAQDAERQTRTVIVGNSSNFVLGMELRAAPSAAQPGYYTIVGKLPPRRGRWT
jgi:hypothetical protein